MYITKEVDDGNCVSMPRSLAAAARIAAGGMSVSLWRVLCWSCPSPLDCQKGKLVMGVDPAHPPSENVALGE